MNNLYQVYKDAIYDEYGVRVGYDKNPKRTKRIAGLILELGISFEDYISITIDLYDDWADAQGHRYPYFTMITGKNALERVSELVKLNCTCDEPDSGFEEELWYVSCYLEHATNGNGSEPPARQYDPGPDVRREVAEYICNTKGIPFVTDNLDYIASDRDWETRDIP